MDPLLIPRIAPDDGLRALLSRLDGLEVRIAQVGALLSQVTATSQAALLAPWLPGPSWADAVAVTLPRPAWATAACLVVGGYLKAEYADTVADPVTLARIRVTDGATESISPEFASLLASLDTSGALTWSTQIMRLGGESVTVSTQARNGGGAVMDGSVAVTATALWVR